jgi:hypothetical protein
MTVARFRNLALSLPGAEERSHMNHPDFRVGGKIFASLGYPDKGWGMVKLTPEVQRGYLRDHPRMFSLASGAWGRQGSTMVRLKDADADVVAEALKAAWRSCATKPSPRRKSKSRV